MASYFYLVHIQYLGFRYHGWQKQGGKDRGLKTIALMLEKTTRCVLGHSDFKILGAARTDAMVSAGHSAFELFVHQPFEPDRLCRDYNRHLPNDIRVIRVAAVDEQFNIIRSPAGREYLYLFSFGEKAHPFSACLVGSFNGALDIDRMKQGALLFKGEHDFRQYCTKPGAETRVRRRIDQSRIERNRTYLASFFPKETWIYRVRARGFLRNQVRLMMGQLLRLGRGQITLADIEASLTGRDNAPLSGIAPASGLVLNRIFFDCPGHDPG